MKAKTTKLLSHVLMIGILLNVISICSCRKNEDVQPVPATDLALTGISPRSGPYATTVTIVGAGFSSIAADNIVK